MGLSVSAVYSQSIDPVKNPGLFIVELSSLNYGSLDPATNYAFSDYNLNEMICETLYDYNGDSVTELVPVLANSYPEISLDGMQINITLNEGIKFQDGVEFNAWVYKYSIDRVMMISDPNGPSFLLEPLKGGQSIQSYNDLNNSEISDYLSKDAVKVISDYQIQINLDHAYVPLISVLTFQVGCAVSPKAIIDNIPDIYVPDKNNNETGMVDLADWFPELAGNYSKLGLNDTLNSQYSGVVPSGGVNSPAQHFWYIDHQVGTGPWILTTKTNSMIELDRNPNWWNASNYHFNAPTKIILKGPNEIDTRIQSVIEGNADSSTIYSYEENQFINPDGSPKINTVKTYLFDTLNIRLFAFNLNNNTYKPNEYIIKYNTSSSAWDNDTALYNAGIIGFSHLQKNATVSNPFSALLFRRAFALSFNYDEYIQTYVSGFGKRLEGLIPEGLLGHQYNLIEENYIPVFNHSGAKALFEDIGWQGEITLRPLSSSYHAIGMANILKQSIESMNVGILIHIFELSPGDNNYTQIYKNIPIFTWGWYPDFADPDTYMTHLLHSSKGYFSKRIGYENLLLDSMLNNASSEYNITLREQLYSDIEKYVADESIFIYSHQQTSFINLWYQWDSFIQSGTINPMRSFPRVHFMEKNAQSKLFYSPMVTSSTITTSSPTSNQINSIYSSIYSSSINPQPNISLSVIILFIIIGVIILGFNFTFNKGRNNPKPSKKFISFDSLYSSPNTNNQNKVKICLNCNFPYQIGDIFCQNCGNKL